MLKYGLIVALCAAPQNPTDMGPPATMARRMRVSLLIRVRVVDPMRCDPLYWAALNGQRAANCEEVFDGFRAFIASVRQQPVDAHADAQTALDPVAYGGRNDPRPTPE